MSVGSSTRSTPSATSTGFHSNPYSLPSQTNVSATNGSLNPVQVTLISMERTLQSLVDTSDLHPILSSLLFSQLYQIKFAMASLSAEERSSHLFEEAHPTPQWTNSQPRGIKKRRNSISENSQMSNSSAEDIDSFRLRRQEAQVRLKKVGEGIHASIIALQNQIQSYLSSSDSATHASQQSISYKPAVAQQTAAYPAIQSTQKYQPQPQPQPVHTHHVPQSHAELTAIAAYDLSRDHVEQAAQYAPVDLSWQGNRVQSNGSSIVHPLERTAEPVHQARPGGMRHSFAPQTPNHVQQFANYHQPEPSHQQRPRNAFPEFAPGLIDDSILNDGFNYAQYHNSRPASLQMNVRHHHDPFMPEMDSPIHRSVDLAAFAALCLSEEAVASEQAAKSAAEKSAAVEVA